MFNRTEQLIKYTVEYWRIRTQHKMQNLVTIPRAWEKFLISRVGVGEEEVQLQKGWISLRGGESCFEISLFKVK